MEFYLIKPQEKTYQDETFQFPTGWNSTEIEYITMPMFDVSIPNGMEFYITKEQKSKNNTSFNSQRDGILL